MNYGEMTTILREELVKAGIVTKDQALHIAIVAVSKEVKEKLMADPTAHATECGCELCKKSESFFALAVDDDFIARAQAAAIKRIFQELFKIEQPRTH